MLHFPLDSPEEKRGEGLLVLQPTVLYFLLSLVPMDLDVKIKGVILGACFLIVSTLRLKRQVFLHFISVTLANHNRRRQSNEPIRTRNKCMKPAPSAVKGGTQVTIGDFNQSDFTSDWLRKWREFF